MTSSEGFLIASAERGCPVFLFIQLESAIVQHDGHGDEQRLGSLDVQRQTEEHACKVSIAVGAFLSL